MSAGDVMSTAAHTPGPWSRDKYGHIVDAKGDAVHFRSVTISCAGNGIAEAERNTDLAAAAPELLAALTALLAMCERQADFNDDGDGGMFERSHAAIAKATGAA